MKTRIIEGRTILIYSEEEKQTQREILKRIRPYMSCPSITSYGRISVELLMHDNPYGVFKTDVQNFFSNITVETLTPFIDRFPDSIQKDILTVFDDLPTLPLGNCLSNTVANHIIYTISREIERAVPHIAYIGNIMDDAFYLLTDIKQDVNKISSEMLDIYESHGFRIYPVEYISSRKSHFIRLDTLNQVRQYAIYLTDVVKSYISNKGADID